METQVELVWLEGQIERWTPFGHPVAERTIDRHRRIVGFAPRSVFALMRSRFSEDGASRSRIAILRAVAAGEGFTTLPYVSPGAEILLNISGWPKVQAVLEAIKAVEQIGVRPEAAAPDHWRHVGARLAVDLQPRRYDIRRHRAWLLRRRLGI